MRKLVPSRSWRFILGISAVLIGLGSLAYSQLAEDPAEDPPPPEVSLPPLPGETSTPSLPDDSTTDPIKRLRDDFVVTRRALARARQNQSESDRRVKTELDRMRKDLVRSKDELRVAQRALADDDPKRITELKRLQGQVDGALAKLNVREQSLALEQATAVRKLQSLEEELEASEGIFADSLAGAATPAEALPAVALLQANLKSTHDDIVSSLNDSSRREKDALAVTQDLEPTVNAAQRELTVAREIAENTGHGKELEAVELRNKLEDAIKSVTELQIDLEESNRLRPEIGEPDLGATRNEQDPLRPDDTIQRLKEEMDASQGLQQSLNEDVEKLRTELKQAFRKIISMQMTLEESDKLVLDLERQRDSLLESRNEGITGVDGMNRLIARLEQELALAKGELSQARDTLNADKIKSAAVINSLASDRDRTKSELERLKALAKVEGRDTVSMLVLEEELNRTKAKLLAMQRQNLVSGSGTEEVKIELKKAFGEIMRLRAELSGKEDLEQQLANLESTMAEAGIPATDAASPGYVNKLIRNLNATKLALQQAQADQDNLRRSLSTEVADLEDKLHQSRDELDQVEVGMARKELEFSDLVKDLENELAITQHKLRQAADAHTQGSDVIKIMDDDLGVAQNHMQRLSVEIQKERMEAARHVRDMQVELETARRRQEAILEDIRSKDETIALKDDEMKRVLARNASFENQLKEVDAMSRTLSELNAVLRSTESVQNVNVDQANALTSQLRDELEQARVDALLAKQSEEDVHRRAGARVDALEKQLKDTQNQLELSKGQFHEVTGEGAELIAEYKGKLNQAIEEIRILKQAGAGETVGTEKLAAQLQEALGAIQVLQHNLTESENVNAEVDDLRFRLAASLEAKINDRELEEAETVALRKKMRTLEMELAMVQQAKSTDVVNSNQIYSKLKDQLLASRGKVAALQARLGQSDVSSVETIASLEEELARSKAEKREIENRMHQLIQGKTETVAALEQQLVLTKSKLDELLAHARQASPLSEGDTQLISQLAEARSAVAKLQADVARGDVENAEIEAQLEKALENMMDMQMAGNESLLRSELDELKRQLAAVKPTSGAPSDRTDSVALASLQLEIDKLKSELDQALQNQPLDHSDALASLQQEINQYKKDLEQASQSVDAVGPQEAELRADLVTKTEQIIDLQTQLAASRKKLDDMNAYSDTLASLQQEINQYKKDLEQASQSVAAVGPQETQLRADLVTKTEQIVDLQTQLASSKKRLDDLNALVSAVPSGDKATLIEANNKLQEAANAIRLLKEDIAKNELFLAKKQEDAAILDEDLKNSFQAMQKLKDERDGFADQNQALATRVAGLEELNGKLTAANKAAAQTSETEERIKRERDDLLHGNLSLQANLDKYKEELRKLQEALASPRPTVGNLGNMQAQINSLESQLQIVKTSESTARKDYDKVSADLMEAMREVMVLETNLGQAEGRINQLESSAPTRPTFGSRTPATNSSLDGSAVKALRDEVIRLRAELEVSQAAGSSSSQTEKRLRDTSRQLLEAQRDLKLANQHKAIFEEQANKVEARRRSDVEREKAANQMVTLLNDKLKREEAKTLALQEGLRKARDAIASLRGEPGAPSIDSGIGSRSSRTSMIDSPSRTTRFTPRTISTPPPRTTPSISSPGFSRVQPRPLPSRTTSEDWRLRTKTTPPSAPEGVTLRSSRPVGRSVERGDAQVDFEAKVLFLNNQTKPASNAEFFLINASEGGIEEIVAGEGIRLPAAISSGAELWARSIHRGYRYPGVAATIRNAISQASIGRFKTNSIGEASIENLDVGRYVVIGTAPLGAVGVVWSHSILVSDGGKVRLDLRNAAWAK